MNVVALVGRLTKDPELKQTNSGKSVCQFTLAVNRPYGEDTDFITCVSWNKTAENLAKYMQKGSRVGVEGAIQNNSYEDSNGTKKYVTFVMVERLHFLSNVNENKQVSSMHQENSSNIGQATTNNITPHSFMQTQKEDPFGENHSQFDISNDDLPF